MLRQAGQIYVAFDVKETRRLRQYVADVEELVGSSFFSPGKEMLTLSSELGAPLQTQLTYAGEEAVRAIVGLFRQLYNHREPTSYNQILKLLSKHADDHNGPLQDQAIEALRELQKWEKNALRPTVALNWRHVGPEGQVREEVLTPAVLIDLFLHGRYLHKGNQKSDKLDAWPLADAAQHSFLGAIRALSQVWWVGRNVVSAVLGEPALLDRPAGETSP